MRELPNDKLDEVIEAFRIISLLSEKIFETVVCDDNADQQVAEDAAIIADRMKAAVTIIDDQYPGFKELLRQADKKSEKRAKELLAQNAAVATKH